MSLQDIVNVQITLENAFITRVGFGTPLIMSNEATSVLSTTTKTYTSVDTMVTDGFSATGATVSVANKLFGQSLRVDRLVVGKRANLTTQVIDLTPIAVNDTLYRVTINGTNFDYTSDPTATVAEITLGITTAINLGAEPVTAVDNTTDLTLTADVAGDLFTLTVDRSLLTQANVTVDPGVVADLVTIRTALDGNDDWYMVTLDSQSAAETLALAASVETLSKQFISTVSDDDIVTASAVDIMSTLQGFSYARTSSIYHPEPQYYAGAAWMGGILPDDPGENTWMFKTLAGVPVVNMTESEKSFVFGKNGNTYTEIAGAFITENGVTASGEYIDTVRGIDFAAQRIREAIFALFKRKKKVPYTNAGIAMVQGELNAVLDLLVRLGVAAEVFDDDGVKTSPISSAPDVRDISLLDKADRLLPDVTFSFVLAGAIHKVVVRGTVSV